MKIESSRAMKMSASRDRGRGFLILRRPERASRRRLSMRAKAPHSRDHRVIDLLGTGDVRL
ncbi:hypothetical protein EHO51_15385 [Methylocystis rosea]|uniref:Uncharacterized protein n=1 Tax=Methylocystis rosea TaxID=173366 RepID=A0A3G8MAZ5_9HYPH|nr:hypothetical protein EHO51_15385 [Methylocystis rosea]